MKTNIALFLILFLSLIGCISSQKEEVDSLKQIPILAWYSIPAEEATLERYQELKEAGFTHSFSHISALNDAKKALELGKQSGLQIIFTCEELRSAPEATVKKVMNHPALAGYFLRDEPSCADFPQLGSWAKQVMATDSSHFCYLNLFPSYAPCEVLKSASYREYVQQFIREVPIQLLSFDSYPIVGNDIREDWYENLEIFSGEARKAKKPFWAFALATAHDAYPIPTLAQLKLQMYSNLAYGAQGLQYFTYWNPDTTTWNFHEAPITLDKKRNGVYDLVTEVNRELQNRAFVFLGATVSDIRHTGSTIPVGTRPLEQLPSPIRSLETYGAGAVVSQLKKGDDCYLVIVNRSFTKPLRLTIEFNNPVTRIRKDGSLISTDLYTPHYLIEAGGAEIFNWKK